MEKRKLLLLGGSPGSEEIIQCAQKQGVYTIVTDWIQPENSIAKRMADEYWMESYSDLDVLEKRCKEENIDAIIAASSDYAIDCMIELCNKLQLPCYCTKESFHYSRDKADFKRVCQEAGLFVPKSYFLSDELLEMDLGQIEFPVVVKPVDQSDSIGISFCYDKEELVKAYHKARSVSENPKIIVEKKIEGREFVAYYALAGGEASLLFLHSLIAPIGMEVRSSFVASNVTSLVLDFVSKVDKKIINALKKMGCTDNIAWIQLILDEKGKFHVIEMGHRIGADIIPIEYSHIGKINIIQWGIECALGVKHLKEDLPKGLKKPMSKYIYSYELCCGKSGIVEEISGIDELRNRNIDIKITIKIGDRVFAGETGMGCAGFCANNINEICNRIEEINNLLQIKNAEGENMILLYMSAERFMQEEFGEF